MPGPRERKLPGSAVLAAIEFEPAAFWAAVSHHVKPLNEEARAELSRIIDFYYVSLQLEQNAPEILVAEARLKNIKTAALAFAQAVRSRSEGNDAERAGRRPC